MLAAVSITLLGVPMPTEALFGVVGLARASTIGTLAGMALPLQLNFIAIAIPAVIAAVAVAMINQGRSASARAHIAHVVGTGPSAVPAGATSK